MALIPAEAAGPAERVERREAIARSREALQALKPQELRALTLLAEGYSYAEIGEITGFSQTKINRCLAEGRERFRSLLSRSEDGQALRRAGAAALRLLRRRGGRGGGGGAARAPARLRRLPLDPARLPGGAAGGCGAGAALPASRSLLDRAHEAFAEPLLAAARRGGATDSAISQVAAAGGTRGAGMAALAKVLAICAGTAGGAAACVAAGVVPAPLDLGPDQVKKPAIERSAEPDTRRAGERRGTTNRRPPNRAGTRRRSRSANQSPRRRRNAARLGGSGRIHARSGAGGRHAIERGGQRLLERQRRRGVRAVMRGLLIACFAAAGAALAAIAPDRGSERLHRQELHRRGQRRLRLLRRGRQGGGRRSAPNRAHPDLQLNGRGGHSGYGEFGAWVWQAPSGTGIVGAAINAKLRDAGNWTAQLFAIRDGAPVVLGTAPANDQFPRLQPLRPGRRARRRQQSRRQLKCYNGNGCDLSTLGATATGPTMCS